MPAALDLYTGSWQKSLLDHPYDPHCEKCMELWRPIFIEMHHETIKKIKEIDKRVAAYEAKIHPAAFRYEN